ncbi:14811_t:CDS:2 [Rhizophagus irregularis]|nr:14811_t:CDS:2 [Rhizophagus irregularis]
MLSAQFIPLCGWKDNGFNNGPVKIILKRLNDSINTDEESNELSDASTIRKGV